MTRKFVCHLLYWESEKKNPSWKFITTLLVYFGFDFTLTAWFRKIQFKKEYENCFKQQKPPGY